MSDLEMPEWVPRADTIGRDRWTDDDRLYLPQRPAWQQKAACRGMGPDLFFTERGASTNPAKEICAACPVRVECLEYGMSMQGRGGYDFGIWGGASARERRRERRVRKGRAA